MRFLSLRFIVLLAALCILALAPCLRAQGDAKADRIVVLVSVDGLAHYYLDDPQAEMPNLRKLAAEGARAQMMKAQMPTVTWPNHTTLVTGVSPAKHGVIGNSYLDRASGKIVSLLFDTALNKDEIMKVPTLYDAAKSAGLVTAAVSWPGTRSAKTLDWTIPCVQTTALLQDHSTPALLAELKAASIPYESREHWYKTENGVECDRMNVQILSHIIRAHHPQFALLHLLEVDHVEHAFGPRSPQAYAAIKAADARIGEVWQELTQAYPGKATLFVVSDHGFLPFQQQIFANVLLKNEGLLQVNDKELSGAARAVGRGGSCSIYLLDAKRRDELLPALAAKFQAVEGVERVILAKDFPALGLPTPQQDPRMGDLILTAKSGYQFSDALTSEVVISPKSEKIKGAHGADPSVPDLHATFVAWGAGIKPGAKLGTIRNLDVAPTVAVILGVKLTDTHGSVLSEALK